MTSNSGGVVVASSTAGKKLKFSTWQRCANAYIGWEISIVPTVDLIRSEAFPCRLYIVPRDGIAFGKCIDFLQVHTCKACNGNHFPLGITSSKPLKF